MFFRYFTLEFLLVILFTFIPWLITQYKCQTNPIIDLNVFFNNMRTCTINKITEDVRDQFVPMTESYR